jgi:hypothetical protein
LARDLSELAPPQNRFAALLAEAQSAVQPVTVTVRPKATTAETPSFWDRVRMLFSPPVLAAASFLLVAGGVVVFSQQSNPNAPLREFQAEAEPPAPVVSSTLAPAAEAPAVAAAPAPTAPAKPAADAPSDDVLLAEKALAPSAPGAPVSKAPKERAKPTEGKSAAAVDASRPPVDVLITGSASGYAYGDGGAKNDADEAEDSEASPAGLAARAKAEATAKRCADAETIARQIQGGTKEAGEGLLAVARCFARTDPAKSRALYRELTAYEGVADEARRALATSEKKKEAPPPPSPSRNQNKALDPLEKSF